MLFDLDIEILIMTFFVIILFYRDNGACCKNYVSICIKYSFMGEITTLAVNFTLVEKSSAFYTWCINNYYSLKHIID
jgi:hypothetical protein